ncbi:hypothetical protein ACTFIN_06120 [Clostridium cagae]|nr:hypothetical protein [Clostridium sp. M14]
MDTIYTLQELENKLKLKFPKNFMIYTKLKQWNDLSIHINGLMKK